MRTITCTQVIQSEPDTRPILRAAIYSRVSTDMEIQEGSFITQNRYFQKKIENDPKLVLAGVYGDFGVSGRSTNKREQFNQMVRDCVDGKIDIIFTKNISRFARNFVDCMSTIKLLKQHKVRIIFEENGIDTGDLKSELLLQILASVAEEESNSIATNLEWANEERAKKGTPFTRPAYGYRREKRSSIWTIEENEAKRVKLAFQRLIDGAAYHQIRDELNVMEREEGTGKVWNSSVVKAVLRNIAYIGDVLTRRYIRIGRIYKKNEGEKDQYYLQDHHEALIDRQTFETVQRIMADRSADFLSNHPKFGKMGEVCP